MLSPSIPLRQWAAAVALAACILAVLLHRFFVQSRQVPSPPSAASIIDVQGDVRHPGTYVLPARPPTVGEAIRAAGGLVGAEAHDTRDLLHQRVAPETLVRVRVGPTGEVCFQVEPMPAATRLTLGLKLDVNAASLEDLILVPRMRAEMARAIVERRNERPLHHLDELADLQGVGPKTVAKWNAYLEVRTPDDR